MQVYIRRTETGTYESLWRKDRRRIVGTLGQVKKAIRAVGRPKASIAGGYRLYEVKG